MIAEITRWIMNSIQSHGWVSVFVGVIIESVIVPIPSPLIIMGAGAILIPTGVHWSVIIRDLLLVIVLPGSIASTLGAFIGYGIGFWGGKPVIERLERFLGFGWEDVQAMDERFSTRPMGLMIFLLRALPVMPLSLISIAVGLVRWPAGPFALWTWAGSVPRCFLLGYLGWLTRDTYEGLAHRVDRLETVFSVLILAAGIGLILWLRARMRKR